MRIFPLLAALAVSALMYMAIFERDALLGLTQGTTQTPAAETGGPDPAGASDVADPDRVKVIVQRSAAAPLASAVIVRGQTTAARQVAVKAETSAVVISTPLRKGATVREAQARLEETLIKLNAAQKLGQGGFSSQTTLATAEATAAAARASVSSAKAGLNAARAGIDAADAAVASTQAELAANRIALCTGDPARSDQAGGLCPRNRNRPRHFWRTGTGTTGRR